MDGALCGVVGGVCCVPVCAVCWVCMLKLSRCAGCVLENRKRLRGWVVVQGFLRIFVRVIRPIVTAAP